MGIAPYHENAGDGQKAESRLRACGGRVLNRAATYRMRSTGPGPGADKHIFKWQPKSREEGACPFLHPPGGWALAAVPGRSPRGEWGLWAGHQPCSAP